MDFTFWITVRRQTALQMLDAIVNALLKHFVVKIWKAVVDVYRVTYNVL